MHSFIYLASQSPRRRELLTQIGVRFALLPADAGEDVEALEVLIDGESAEAYVRRVCLAKAEAASARRIRLCLPAAPILTADTTVVCEGSILGKPADGQQAIAMLQRLSGRTHQVLTAVAVVSADTPMAVPQLVVSRSEVSFAPLDETLVRAYVESGEPFGKAGAYGIQGAAATFISALHGSYSGVMGLPLFETARLLRAAGVAVPSPSADA